MPFIENIELAKNSTLIKKLFKNNYYSFKLIIHELNWTLVKLLDKIYMQTRKYHNSRKKAKNR